MKTFLSASVTIGVINPFSVDTATHMSTSVIPTGDNEKIEKGDLSAACQREKHHTIEYNIME